MDDHSFGVLITEDTVEQPPDEHYPTFDFEQAFPDSVDHPPDELTAQDRGLPDIESGTLDLGAEYQANQSQVVNNIGISYLDNPTGERAQPTRSIRTRKHRTRNPAGDIVPQRKVTRRNETSKRSRSKSRERRIAVAEKERLIREAMARKKAVHDERQSVMVRATPSGAIAFPYGHVEGVLQVEVPANNLLLSPQWPENVPEATAAFGGNRAHWDSYDMFADPNQRPFNPAYQMPTYPTYPTFPTAFGPPPTGGSYQRF